MGLRMKNLIILEFAEKSKKKQLDCDLKVKLNGIKALFNRFSQTFANSN